jgi:hypothetical protein
MVVKVILKITGISLYTLDCHWHSHYCYDDVNYRNEYQIPPYDRVFNPLSLLELIYRYIVLSYFFLSP